VALSLLFRNRAAARRVGARASRVAASGRLVIGGESAMNLTQYDPFKMPTMDPFRAALFDPFKEMREFQNRFTTLFNRIPLKGEELKEETLATTQWMPAVDIIEDEKEYLIKAELPDVRREDVHVNIQDGILALAGERKLEKEEKGKKFHRVERAYGWFNRTFELPMDVNPAKILAEFKDGVLKVHLPKSEEAKPKAIEVKVG
jgi:HSP20 family protein